MAQCCNSLERPRALPSPRFLSHPAFSLALPSPSLDHCTFTDFRFSSLFFFEPPLRMPFPSCFYLLTANFLLSSPSTSFIAFVRFPLRFSHTRVRFSRCKLTFLILSFANLLFTPCPFLLALVADLRFYSLAFRFAFLANFLYFPCPVRHPSTPCPPCHTLWTLQCFRCTFFIAFRAQVTCTPLLSLESLRPALAFLVFCTRFPCPFHSCTLLSPRESSHFLFLPILSLSHTSIPLLALSSILSLLFYPSLHLNLK
jgi:hypothetical protein